MLNSELAIHMPELIVKQRHIIFENSEVPHQQTQTYKDVLTRKYFSQSNKLIQLHSYYYFCEKKKKKKKKKKQEKKKNTKKHTP